MIVIRKENERRVRFTLDLSETLNNKLEELVEEGISDKAKTIRKLISEKHKEVTKSK